MGGCRTGIARRGAAGDITVEVTDRQRMLRSSRRGLERLGRRALVAEGVARAEIGVVLVDDRRIAALHERWLGVPGPTDVITFDLAAGHGRAGGQTVVGEIVVSTETARAAARLVGWTPRREVAYLIVHGVLHLTGHDDRTPADRRAMRARERAVMRACGLPRPPRRAAVAGRAPRTTRRP
ncbi:MAG: rRNA maturation RNase YbeY [Planctomycetia bacterium]